MKPTINIENMLWIVGVLQPVSVHEVHEYLKIVLKRIEEIPSEEDISRFCLEQMNGVRLLRVSRNPDLYSLTAKGNEYLSPRRRKARDKARLYLLKSARKAKILMSREGLATGLGGDAPSVDGRPDIKGREANKIGHVVPSGQTYWPRFSKQLIDKTGLSQHSRDIPYLPFVSFADEKQVDLAMGKGKDWLGLNINSIGLMLGISPQLVFQMQSRPTRHYRHFTLPKKTGGTRPIDSPRTFLKVVQQFFVDYFLGALPVHDSVESYRLGHSIIDNAKRHCQKDYVANIDIENFFGSVSFRSIVQLLLQNGYDERSAKTVASLCTLDGRLPQGAPSSPILSNAVLVNFDRIVFDQCQNTFGITYSRYADDITLSGDDLTAIHAMIELIRNLLKSDFSLALNEKKMRIASHHGQQKVTGVVVNDAPRPPRVFRRRVRAAFNNAEKLSVVEKETEKRLSGYLSYLKSFDELGSSSEILKYSEMLSRLRAVRQRGSE